MQFYSDTALMLFMLATSIASLVLAQPLVTDIPITLCRDWNGSGDNCYNFNYYIYQTSFNDAGNVVASNSATQINTGQINSISTLQIWTPNVECTFGNLIVSTIPSVICGGYTVRVNTSSGQYNLGEGISADYALNDDVLCFYCFHD